MSADENKLSPIWVERVIEKHKGPPAEVQAHFRALGLTEKQVAAAMRAWARRHGESLDRLGIDLDDSSSDQTLP